MRSPTSERVCFLLQLKADRVQDYLEAHEVVWPEMLEALQQATHRMAQTAVNDKWQSTMSDYFQASGGQHPDQAMRRLTEYFHLE